jgi:preprotein translocase subunit SecA
MTETQQISSTKSYQAFDLLNATREEKFAEKLNGSDKQTLYLLISQSVDPELEQRTLAFINKLISGEQQLATHAYIFGSKPISELSINVQAGISKEEKQFLYFLHRTYAYLNGQILPEPESFGSESERLIHTIEDLKTKAAEFKKNNNLKAETSISELATKTIKVATRMFYSFGLIPDNKGQNVYRLSKPLVIMLLKNNVAAKLDQNSLDKLTSDVVIAVRDKAVRNLEGGAFEIKMPSNEEDRLLLRLYAEMFTVAGIADPKIKWETLDDAGLIKLVNDGVKASAKDGKFTYLAQRYLVFECVSKNNAAIKEQAGKTGLVEDFIGASKDASKQSRILNDINGILSAKASSTINLVMSIKEGKVTSSRMTYAVNGETPIETSDVSSQDLGACLIYAMSAIYGTSTDKAIDPNTFIGMLVKFCTDNDLKKSNIKGVRDETTIKAAITINKELLNAVFSRYYASVGGSQQRFVPTKTAEGNMLQKTGSFLFNFEEDRPVNLKKPTFFGVPKLLHLSKVWNKVPEEVDKSARIADLSQIVPIKLVLVAKGKPCSSPELEMLASVDIQSIAEVYGHVEEVKNDDGAVTKAARTGLSDADKQTLNDFADNLSSGKYLGKRFPNIREFIVDRYVPCITSLTEVEDPKTPEEVLYNKAVRIIRNKIAYQHRELVPQTQPEFWDVFASLEAQSGVKLAGVQDQITIAFKGEFYPKQINDLKNKLAEVGNDAAKLSYDDKQNFGLYIGDKVTADFWTRLTLKYYDFFSGINGMSEDLGLDIQFPFKFGDGYVAGNEVDFMGHVISYMGELKTLKPEPGEEKILTVTKKMVSYSLLMLGAFTIEDKNTLADILAVFPANGWTANIVLKGAAFVSDNTFKTSERDGTTQKGIGAKRMFEESPIMLKLVNKLKGATQATQSNKTSFAPYVYMFIASFDKQAAARTILEIAASGSKEDIFKKLSTLDASTIEKAITLMNKKVDELNKIPGVADIVKNDKDLQKLMAQGAFDVSGGRIVLKYSAKLNELLNIVKTKYNGSFSYFYAETEKIPDDKGARMPAKNFLDTIIAIYSITGVVTTSLGKSSIDAAITNADVISGLKIVARRSPQIQESFTRYSEQAAMDVPIKGISEKNDTASINIGQLVKDIKAKDLNASLGDLKGAANKIGSDAGDFTVKALATSAETSYQFLTVRLYFGRTYVNMTDKLFQAAISKDPGKMLESLTGVVGDFGSLTAQMAYYGFNPLALLDVDHLKYLIKHKKWDQLIGYLSVVGGYATYVVQRDLVMLRNINRSLSGRGKIEMQYSALEWPIGLADKALSKMADLIPKEVRQKWGKPFGKIDDGLGKVQEKIAVGEGAIDKAVSSNVVTDLVVKRMLWQGTIRLEWVNWLMDKAGKVVGDTFYRAADKLRNEPLTKEQFRKRLMQLQEEMFAEAFEKLSPAEMIEFEKLVTTEYASRISGQEKVKMPPSFLYSSEGEQAVFQLKPGKKGANVMLEYGNPTAMVQMAKVETYLRTLPKNKGGLPVIDVEGKNMPVVEVAVTAGSNIGYNFVEYEGVTGIKLIVGADIAATSHTIIFKKAMNAVVKQIQAAKPQDEALINESAVVEDFENSKGTSTLTLNDIKINGNTVDGTVKRINSLEGVMKTSSWDALQQLNSELKAQASELVTEAATTKEKMALIENAQFKHGTIKGMTLLEVRLAVAKEMFRRLTDTNAKTGEGAGELPKKWKNEVEGVRRFAESRIPGGKTAMAAQLQAALVLQHELTSIQADPGEGKTLDGALFDSVASLTDVKIYKTTHDKGAADQLYKDLSVMDKAMGISSCLVDSDKMAGSNKMSNAFEQHQKVVITQAELNFIILNNRAALESGEKIKIDYKNGILLLDELDFMIVDQGQTPHIISGPGMPEAEDASLWRKTWKQVGGQFSVGGLRVGGLKEKCFTDGKLNDLGRNELKWETLSLEQQHMINMCVRARNELRDGIDYEASSFKGMIYLIDKSTGRMLSGHEFSEGLQQALQAKHGVKVTPPMQNLESGTMAECLALFSNKLGMSASLDQIKSVMDVKGLQYLVLDTSVPRYDYDPSLSYEDNLKAAKKVLSRAVELGVSFGENRIQVRYQANPVMPEEESVNAEEVRSGKENAGIKYDVKTQSEIIAKDKKAPAPVEQKKAAQVEENVAKLIDELESMKFSNDKKVQTSKVRMQKEVIFNDKMSVADAVVNDISDRVKGSSGKQSQLKPTLINTEDPNFAEYIGQQLEKKGFIVQVITHNNEKDLETIRDNGMKDGMIVITTLARRATDISIKSKQGGLQYIVDRGSTDATMKQKMGRIPRFGASGEIVRFSSLQDPIWYMPVKGGVAKLLLDLGFSPKAVEAAKGGIEKQFAGKGNPTYQGVATLFIKMAKEDEMFAQLVPKMVDLAQSEYDNRIFVNEYVTSRVNNEFQKYTKDLYDALDSMQNETKAEVILQMTLDNDIDHILEKNGIVSDKAVTPEQLSKLQKDIDIFGKGEVEFKGAQGVHYTGADVKASLIRAFKDKFISSKQKYSTSLSGTRVDWRMRLIDAFNTMRRNTESVQQDMIRVYNQKAYKGGKVFTVASDGELKVDKKNLTLLDQAIEQLSGRIQYERHIADSTIVKEYVNAAGGTKKGAVPVQLQKGGEVVTLVEKGKAKKAAGSKEFKIEKPESYAEPEDVRDAEELPAAARKGKPEKKGPEGFGKNTVGAAQADFAGMLVQSHDNSLARAFKNEIPEMSYEQWEKIENKYLAPNVTDFTPQDMSKDLGISLKAAENIRSVHRLSLAPSRIGRDGMSGLFATAITAPFISLLTQNRLPTWREYGNSVGEGTVGWMEFGGKVSMLEISGVSVTKAMPWVLGLDYTSALAKAKGGEEGKVGVGGAVNLGTFLGANWGLEHLTTKFTNSMLQSKGLMTAEGILVDAKAMEYAQKLQSIKGGGVMMASIMAATVADLGFNMLYGNSEYARKGISMTDPTFNVLGTITAPITPSYYMENLLGIKPQNGLQKAGMFGLDLAAFYPIGKFLVPRIASIAGEGTVGVVAIPLLGMTLASGIFEGYSNITDPTQATMREYVAKGGPMSFTEINTVSTVRGGKELSLEIAAQLKTLGIFENNKGYFVSTYFGGDAKKFDGVMTAIAEDNKEYFKTKGFFGILNNFTYGPNQMSNMSFRTSLDLEHTNAPDLKSEQALAFQSMIADAFKMYNGTLSKDGIEMAEMYKPFADYTMGNNAAFAPVIDKDKLWLMKQQYMTFLATTKPIQTNGRFDLTAAPTFSKESRERMEKLGQMKDLRDIPADEFAAFKAFVDKNDPKASKELFVPASGEDMIFTPDSAKMLGFKAYVQGLMNNKAGTIEVAGSKNGTGAVEYFGSMFAANIIQDKAANDERNKFAQEYFQSFCLMNNVTDPKQAIKAGAKLYIPGISAEQRKYFKPEFLAQLEKPVDQTRKPFGAADLSSPTVVDAEGGSRTAMASYKPHPGKLF